MGKTNMMKKLVMLVVAVVMSMGLMACGCHGGSKEVTEKNVVILWGGTANEAQLNLNQVEEEVKEACKSYGSVTIIQVDGDPYLVNSLDIPKPKKKYSKTKAEQIASTQAEQIMGLMKQCVPKTEEMDMLKGIQMGARQLAGCEGEKVLLVASSGVATTGLVDFTDILLEADQSEKMIQHLEEESAIPDLTDVHVMWAGMGETVAPQTDLYDKNRKNLKVLWETVLEESGAVDVNITSDLAVEEKTSDNLPKVSVVPIAQPASVMAEGDFSYEDLAKKENERIITFGDEKLSFKAGSPELTTSEEAVKNLFQGMIQYMKETPEYRVLLAGTTASAGTKEELNQLSLARVETIKSIFVAEGVNPEQIKVVGLGYENNFTIKDTDKDGNFIEDLGKKNRAVHVMNAESNKAIELLGGES